MIIKRTAQAHHSQNKCRDSHKTGWEDGKIKSSADGCRATLAHWLQILLSLMRLRAGVAPPWADMAHRVWRSAMSTLGSPLNPEAESVSELLTRSPPNSGCDRDRFRTELRSEKQMLVGERKKRTCIVWYRYIRIPINILLLLTRLRCNEWA